MNISSFSVSRKKLKAASDSDVAKEKATGKDLFVLVIPTATNRRSF